MFVVRVFPYLRTTGRFLGRSHPDANNLVLFYPIAAVGSIQVPGSHVIVEAIVTLPFLPWWPPVGSDA